MSAGGGKKTGKKKAVNQCMGLDASNINIASAPIVSDIQESWNLFSPDAIEALNEGKTIFAFACRVGNALTPADKEVISSMVNLSKFKDETKENNVPHIDVNDAEEAEKYTVIITKTAYLIRDIDLDDITPELMLRPEYHKCCQPGNPQLHDCDEPQTFRMTKTVIPVVFKITLQLKTSELSMEETLPLAIIDGFPATKAIMMERTKRNIQTLDATRKVKSILLYNQVPGGILVRHTVVVYNTMIPTVAASVLNNLGSMGSSEATQTAQMTRNALPQLLDGVKDVKPWVDPNAGWFW